MLYKIVLIIAAVVALIWVRKFILQKALRLVVIQSQNVTDEAVTKTLPQVKLAQFDGNKAPALLESTMPQRVWGKGIMVFEYQLAAQSLSQKEVAVFKQQLTKHLSAYAQTNKLPQFEASPVFVVSDAWVLNGTLHFDVTNIVNNKSLQYLHDLNQLEK